MINPKKPNSTSESGSKSSLNEDDKPTEHHQNPGMISGLIQMFNPFKSSAKCSSTSESGSKSSLTDSNGNDKATEHKQNPGMISGLIQMVNPFKSSSKSCNDLISSQNTDENNQEEMLASSPSTEPGSTTMLGFEWDHFKTDSIGNPTVTEMATNSEALQEDDDDEDLLEWWKNVKGWDEWNETTNFEGDDSETAIESTADRVYKAARLFVYLFKQREASLYMRVTELLEVADAADSFHKKTVTASIGGGVASVAGSITTITGLALAPFTFGSSLIVTAVGIGVATAGGLTSASANITDTMHSRTDRTRVEQIILSYQEEIKDIRECLQFLQTGMETLEEYNFQQYMDSISKRAMNRNVKHVMKEGGRAGKALFINAESLASTVQVLSTAGGVAKATQVLSIASGVMSGLFLALDVFFLARDSRELHKGAKTKFAAKIRDVCKELLDGLVELKKIKNQLQKIMTDAEEEEEEEEGEDEEEYEEKEECKKPSEHRGEKDNVNKGQSSNYDSS
ncbi:apolipoprotein L1 [Tachysurus vachellii]|uniref:apolipoprotein L1 n=1 Tax=Tachysurus vachellii TaxID=175792 RepID=UPI00296ADA62|nr:apolipoprotein L1 [Tachysurus vachellii]